MYLHAFYFLFQFQSRELYRVPDRDSATQHRPSKHRALAFDRKAVVHGEEEFFFSFFLRQSSTMRRLDAFHQLVHQVGHAVQSRVKEVGEVVDGHAH